MEAKDHLGKLKKNCYDLIQPAVTQIIPTFGCVKTPLACLFLFGPFKEYNIVNSKMK